MGRRNEEENTVSDISSSPFHMTESGKETKDDGEDTRDNDPLSLSYSVIERGLEIREIRPSISL